MYIAAVSKTFRQGLILGNAPVLPYSGSCGCCFIYLRWSTKGRLLGRVSELSTNPTALKSRRGFHAFVHGGAGPKVETNSMMTRRVGAGAKLAGNIAAATNVVHGMGFDNFVEEIQVLGRDLVDKVRELIHEGNVQRIVVKDEDGHTFLEIPVAVAAVGAIVAPLLAAIGAISALVAKFTIVVVRSEVKAPEDEQAKD